MNRNTNGITCKRCGATSLYWQKVSQNSETRFVLYHNYNYDGVVRAAPHDCNDYRGAVLVHVKHSRDGKFRVEATRVANGKSLGGGVFGSEAEVERAADTFRAQYANDGIVERLTIAGAFCSLDDAP